MTLLIFFCATVLFGQEKPEDYKIRAEKNLELLAKHSSIKDHINITNQYVDIYSRPNAPKAEFRLYWTECNRFLRLIESYDYYDQVEFYVNKGIRKLSLSEWEVYYAPALNLPTSFKGLRVAIDPGHFAGNYQEAIFEDRYIKVKKEEFGLDEDIRFFEADLAYNTAYLIKDTLEKLGAFPYLTRERGQSAVGINFDEWYTTHFERDVYDYKASGDLSEQQANWLLTEATRNDVFRRFYKYLDFIGRARKINDKGADLTVIIHYNADEFSGRDENNYWKPTNDNYSMSFVPGSFLKGELKKQDARIEFMRLLLSNHLDESLILAESIMAKHNNNLGVPPLPSDNHIAVDEKTSIYTGIEGVYARNLALTRLIQSPLVYVESLLQDNKEELLKLSKKDFTLGNITTSQRIADVAYHGFLEGIEDWLKVNRDRSKELKLDY